jgi:peptidoglycan/LPS O-acetylase OafA/YrhL
VTKELRKDIEGLRAIAILMVVAYHAHVPWMSGGFVGVDVFFVLSGYLITQLLVFEIASTGTIDIARFYARRARRLLPAVGVLLLAVVCASAVLYAPFEQGDLSLTALSTSAYLSNVYFAKTATDYHSPAAQTNPLLHTWSLSVEEQFYAVWPLLMLFAARRARKRGESSERNIGMVLALLALLSFGLSLYWTEVRQPWAFFLSPTRAWEFALGASGILLPGFDRWVWIRALFSGERTTPDASQRRVRIISGWLGFGIVLLSGVVFDDKTPFPGIAAMLPAIGTLLVLRSGAGSSPASPRLLNTRVLQEIGRLSYSWYLWHWPLLVFGIAMFPDTGLPGRVGLVLGALVLAELSYRLVEHPIRSSRLLVGRPALALYMAAGITLGGIGLSVAWNRVSARWSTGESQAKFSAARNDSPVIYPMKCDEWFFSSAVKECSFGPAQSARTVVLFGDSHAGQWFPAVEQAFVPHGWHLIVMTKSGCPAVDAPFVYNRIGRVYTECDVWRRSALARIAILRPDLVVVGSWSGYPFSQEQLRDGTQRVLKSLSESSRQVALMADTVGPGSDLPRCRARASWRPSFVPGPDCTSYSDAPRRLEVESIQNSLARGFDNVTVVDLNSLICAGGVCGWGKGDAIPFRDDSHLTASFARALGPALRAKIVTEFSEGSWSDGLF